MTLITIANIQREKSGHKRNRLKCNRRHQVQQSALAVPGGRLVGWCKIEIAHVTPVLAIDGDREARQVLAPAARNVPNVEVLDEEDEADESANECHDPQQSPCPPRATSVAEEGDRLVNEGLESFILRAR